MKLQLGSIEPSCNLTFLVSVASKEIPFDLFRIKSNVILAKSIANIKKFDFTIRRVYKFDPESDFHVVLHSNPETRKRFTIENS